MESNMTNGTSKGKTTPRSIKKKKWTEDELSDVASESEGAKSPSSAETSQQRQPQKARQPSNKFAGSRAERVKSASSGASDVDSSSYDEQEDAASDSSGEEEEAPAVRRNVVDAAQLSGVGTLKYLEYETKKDV